MGTLVKTDRKKDANDLSLRVEYWEHQFGQDYEIGEITRENSQKIERISAGLTGGVVLDNGCGDGRFKRFFESKGWNVYGTDISKNAIIRASKITPVNLLVAASEELPFKNNFFDVIFSWRVLHSLPKKERVESVRECDRVLKKGGCLICSVQSVDDEHTRSKYRDSGEEVKDDKETYLSDMQVGDKIVQRLKHFYSKDELIKEVENNSHLKVVDIVTYSEKSGWNSDLQQYWVIKAIKQ